MCESAEGSSERLGRRMYRVQGMKHAVTDTERGLVSDRLLVWISESPERCAATNGQLAEAVGASVRAVNNALDRLERDGRIRREYTAPDRARGDNGRRIAVVDGGGL